MKKLGKIFLVVFFFSIISLQHNEAKSKNFYRTFEIIAITDKGLTLQDNDGNLIEVAKDAGDYKAGYNVRYDSVRNRLKAYRWQDYEVAEISSGSITLQHKTGDIISVAGNYAGRFDIGDQVRYDTIDKKIQPAADYGLWKQYTVSATSSTEIIIENTAGEKLAVLLNNNLYPEHRGVYIAKYKVGDMVRYNAETNNLKKGVIRTYDWQYYEIKAVNDEQVVLINKDREEVTLDNTYDTELKAGEQVKYDRINNLLKKVR